MLRFTKPQLLCLLEPGFPSRERSVQMMDGQTKKSKQRKTTRDEGQHRGGQHKHRTQREEETRQKWRTSENQNVNAAGEIHMVLLKFATAAGFYSMFCLRAKTRFGRARTPGVLKKFGKNSYNHYSSKAKEVPGSIPTADVLHFLFEDFWKSKIRKNMQVKNC